MLRLVGGAVGPRRVVVVGERHVAGAQRVHHAQRGQRAVDRVTAFHADHRGDAALLEGALDVVGTERQLEGLGPLLQHAVHDVDLLHRGHHRLGRRNRRRHVDRPELPAEAAGPQPRDVGHQRRHALRDVGLREIASRIESAQRPGIVVVAVDERRLPVQGLGAGEQVRLRREGGRGHEENGRRGRAEEREGRTHARIVTGLPRLVRLSRRFPARRGRGVTTAAVGGGLRGEAAYRGAPSTAAGSRRAAGRWSSSPDRCRPAWD